MVGIDLQTVEWREAPPNLRLIEGDFLQASAESLLEGIESRRRGPTRFDVVLSDMMAFTTGSQGTDHHASARIVERLLASLPALLREGGNLVYKIFEGERSPELLQKTRDCFEKAKPYKPAASRDDSVEIFVVGHGFIPEAAPAMPPEPKRGPPSPVQAGAADFCAARHLHSRTLSFLLMPACERWQLSVGFRAPTPFATGYRRWSGTSFFFGVRSACNARTDPGKGAF